MARRKAPAQVAPKTLEEAIAILSRFSHILSEIADAETTVETAIAAIKAEFDATVAPRKEELETLFRMLKPWWAVAGDEMTEGKRKSIELGGCVIGTRMSTPKVKVPATEKDAIADLLDFGRLDFLRVKPALEKPMILRALDDAEDGPFLAWLGISSSQKEEFFVDRLPPKAPAVEVVPDQEDVA